MLLRTTLLALTCLQASLLHAELPPEASQLLQEAGNATDDHIRQSALEKMAALPSLDATQRKEAASLADFAKRWNGSSLKFYGASMREKPCRALGDYDFGVAPDSPSNPCASSIAVACSSGFSPFRKPRFVPDPKPPSVRIVVPALAGIWRLFSHKQRLEFRTLHQEFR